MTAPLSPDQASAKAIIRGFLEQWGLIELEGDVDRLVKDGLGADAIQLELQQTESYKKRFAGNAIRQKAGLSVLSPAEYIAAETAYRSALSRYGLPSSFYDQPDDFHGFIGRDVSPDEVNARAKAAQTTWLTTDEATRQVWRDFYGLTDGAAIASILDPERALPVVERMATAAQIGGAAARNGLAADRNRFEQYADLGVDAARASDAFAEIGLTRRTEEGMAARFGTTFSQSDAEQARLMGTAGAQRKQQELYRSEEALFEGRAAADVKSTNRRTSGSY